MTGTKLVMTHAFIAMRCLKAVHLDGCTLILPDSSTFWNALASGANPHHSDLQQVQPPWLNKAGQIWPNGT